MLINWTQNQNTFILPYAEESSDILCCEQTFSYIASIIIFSIKIFHTHNNAFRAAFTNMNQL